MSQYPIDQAQTLEIQFQVANASQLHLIIRRNGSISRRGDGEQPDGPIAMGRIEGEVFTSLVDSLPEEVWSEPGRYELSRQGGDPFLLSVGLTGEGLDTGLAFQYDSEGVGPPEELIEFVEAALDATEEWYQDQLPQKHRKGR